MIQCIRFRSPYTDIFQIAPNTFDYGSGCKQAKSKWHHDQYDMKERMEPCWCPITKFPPDEHHHPMQNIIKCVHAVSPGKSFRLQSRCRWWLARSRFLAGPAGRQLEHEACADHDEHSAGFFTVGSGQIRCCPELAFVLNTDVG